MINHTPDLDITDLIDWRSLNETRITLSVENFQKAANLSKSIFLSQQRWQVYINALAVLGFEKWLQERSPDLNIDIQHSSIWKSAYANLIPAACNIQVGNFKVCIINDSNLNREHSVPFAAFDIPNFTAHFYVLMQVEEEQGEVAVSGFMSYQQYQKYQRIDNIPIESDWTYTIPEDWFNPDANALLLNLRCLAADAIQLPQVENNLSLNLSLNSNSNLNTNNNYIKALRQKIINLQSRLRQQYPWQLLTLAEGKQILNEPELIKCVYSQSNSDNSVSIQPLINVANWLQNQVETATEELGWMLMPSLAPSGMRYLETFTQIRTGLEQQGINISPAAQGAYRDLECDRGSLRLYAIAWIHEDNSEWTLIVVLSSQPEKSMPEKLNLEVRDETQQLFSQTLKDTTQGILYAEVIGSLDECFWINITADDEFLFEIPPFGLEME